MKKVISTIDIKRITNMGEREMKGNAATERIVVKLKPFIKEGVNPNTNKPYYNHVWEIISDILESEQLLASVLRDIADTLDKKKTYVHEIKEQS